MVDLAKLLKIKEQFILETGPVGKLRVCPLSDRGLQKLKNDYDYLKKASPIDIVQYFLTIVAYLHNPEKKEISPDDPKISIRDSKKLSEEELNQFSDKFIEYNEDYLLQEIEVSGTKISFSKADMQREENESSISYLSRLILYRIEEYIDIENDFIESIKGLSSIFPNHLSRDILNTFETSRRLYENILPFQRETENIRKYSGLLHGINNSFSRPIEPKPIPIPRIERPIDYIEKTIERLDILIEYQSKMGPVIEDSSNLLGDMNRLWIGIAADSKKDSRKIIRLTILIIFISLIGLFSGVLFSWLNYKSSIENPRLAEKYMSLLLEENRKLNNNIQKYQSNLDKFINNQSEKENSIKSNKKSEKVD